MWSDACDVSWSHACKCSAMVGGLPVVARVGVLSRFLLCGVVGMLWWAYLNRLCVCLCWFPALVPACVCLPTTAPLCNTHTSRKLSAQGEEVLQRGTWCRPLYSDFLLHMQPGLIAVCQLHAAFLRFRERLNWHIYLQQFLHLLRFRVVCSTMHSLLQCIIPKVAV